ncbi:hypothetical protein Moror_16983 [Moniliophthora roreri MCA 2997]|uniref:Uncharacterized protein n=1 Tax=Moniliophthora roreri (strain MCA 2997) TaxID=1381753 RepID=V2WVI4_MONRO|nr:hypothetical protein Moror_16983 [Moniliophthora roreri MCA 2997]
MRYENPPSDTSDNLCFDNEVVLETKIHRLFVLLSTKFPEVHLFLTRNTKDGVFLEVRLRAPMTRLTWSFVDSLRNIDKSLADSGSSAESLGAVSRTFSTLRHVPICTA